MTILSKINKLREQYERKHNTAPELVFLNFKTWEEVLKDPQSVNGVPNIIAGCEMIPANEMLEDILYCDNADLEKALRYFDGSNCQVIIKKLTVVDRPEAQNARRVIADRSFQNFQIPPEAIKAYQRHQQNKNLNF